MSDPLPNAQIAAALVAAQLEITNPHKNREVTVQPREGRSYSFRYATLDSILDSVRPILAKNGIAILQSICTEGDKPALRTDLLHKSGESISCTVRMTLERDGNQALGSAMTYARRYGLMGLLALAADEDDDGNAADGHAVQKAADTQPAAPARAPVVTPRTAAALVDAPHIALAKDLMKSGGSELVRQLNKSMGLADWAAVNALTGAQLDAYRAGLKPNMKGNA